MKPLKPYPAPQSPYEIIVYTKFRLNHQEATAECPECGWIIDISTTPVPEAWIIVNHVDVIHSEEVSNFWHAYLDGIALAFAGEGPRRGD